MALTFFSVGMHGLTRWVHLVRWMQAPRETVLVGKAALVGLLRCSCSSPRCSLASKSTSASHLIVEGGCLGVIFIDPQASTFQYSFAPSCICPSTALHPPLLPPPLPGPCPSPYRATLPPSVLLCPCCCPHHLQATATVWAPRAGCRSRETGCGAGRTTLTGPS